MNPEQITAIRAIAELTKPKCATCRTCKPYRCCESFYCEVAKGHMRLNGITPPEPTGHDIPYMGKDGCILPPEYRPICALHHCDIASLGFFKNDPDATKEYFRLRYIVDGYGDYDDGYNE